MAQIPDNKNTAMVDKSTGRLIPIPGLSSIVTIVTIIFLLYAFFSGLSMQFYASFLFLFYSWTKKMWISVMMLGVFQTLLMIPFRIVNLIKSTHLEEFKETVEEIRIEQEQQYFLKRKFDRGGRIALYYIVHFFAALVSYTSIGRLFLTDFYNTKLDPQMLYSFVSYPDYPLMDRMFKLPYAWFSSVVDLGQSKVLWVWAILIAVQLVIYAGLSVMRNNKTLTSLQKKRIRNISTGNLFLLLVLSWWVIRHFPSNWSLRIFSGDVAIPNKTLNTVTAVATFFTLIWTNMPKLRKKISLAKQEGFDPQVIARTEKVLFLDNLKVASVVGLGAYFITNLIPSAFELSIFTLEIISWTAPFTLDRLILKTTSTMKEQSKKKDSEKKIDKDKKPESKS